MQLVALFEETLTVCPEVQTSKASVEIQNLPGSVRGEVSAVTFQFIRPIMRVNGVMVPPVRAEFGGRGRRLVDGGEVRP